MGLEKAVRTPVNFSFWARGETEDCYQGLDIIDHAKAFAALHGDRYVAAPEQERRDALVAYALPKNSSGSGQGRAGEYGRASSNRPPFSRRRAREKVSSQRALGKRTGAPRRQTA